MIRIHPTDNIAVTITDFPVHATRRVANQHITAREPIPMGHKAALVPIAKGDLIIKYGFPIGRATTAIEPGAWVHTHNVTTTLEGILDYTYTPQEPSCSPLDDGQTFQGYRRENGDVGIRNELWIIPTVSCVNKTAETLARQLTAELEEERGIDGVYAFPHPYGCSQLGEDHVRTQQILADLVKHPNAGGVLVLGLGCENNTIEEFQKILGPVNPQQVRFLIAQEHDDEMEAARQELRRLADYARQFQREAIPVAELRVGLKCGGSDGFSGMTANPLVGAFSDLLTARGGSTILTEVPEMFGAETLLLNRCTGRAVFDKCVKMINDFKTYFLRHNQPVYENPSPGNKQGGITTLEEKSLGCTQKGGTSPVTDILDYGDRLKTPGLNLLTGPGNDGISTTVLTAAGAHLILFTTGRGNPLGTPVPNIKIASNSLLAARKPHWIDFDAGVLLNGVAMPDLAQQLFDQVLDVASGTKRTNNELNGYREISILKDGVTL